MDNVIAKIKIGDESVLFEVYKQYRGEFIAWSAKNYSCSSEDAKDIFQEVIIKFYNNIIHNRLTDLTCDLKTYLFAIGKFHLLNLIKKRGRTVTFSYDELINVQEPSYDPMTKYEEEFIKETVKKHLDLQCDDCKKVLEMYYFKEMDMKAIAIEMGYKNADVAKKKKYECFKKLAIMVRNKLTLLVL